MQPSPGAHFRNACTAPLICVPKDGVLIPDKKLLTVFGQQPRTALLFCLACPIFTAVGNCVKRPGGTVVQPSPGAHFCCRHIWQLTLIHHPASQGTAKQDILHLITEREEANPKRQLADRGHHVPRENLEASL